MKAPIAISIKVQLYTEKEKKAKVVEKVYDLDISYARSDTQSQRRRNDKVEFGMENSTVQGPENSKGFKIFKSMEQEFLAFLYNI